MTTKFSVFIFLFMLVALPFYGIDLKYLKYDWESKPTIHKLSSTDAALEELILKEKHAVEYIYDEKTKELTENKLFHIIIRVNSNEAIEKNNRIYIPSGAAADFIIHKARVITSTGRIIELQDKDIKEAEDEESKMTFRFFALEGLDLGSEIEYFYLLKTGLHYTGVREILQSKTPKRNVEMEIISPLNLSFLTKSYNGLKEMQLDTTKKEKRELYLRVDSMPALVKEDYSAYQANLQCVIYKLNSNSYNNSNDIISYGFISDRFYKLLMVQNDKKVSKKLQKLISTINIKNAKNDEEKIRIIERYVKFNFVYIDNGLPAFSDLATILEKKLVNEEGTVKLFAALLKELKIEYQLVVTSDRMSLKFDPDFEAYNFLNNYLLYLPSLKLYMAPFDRIGCLGLVPARNTNNYGLFIKEINLGDYTTAVGKINFIPAVAYDKTSDVMNVDIVFPGEILRPTVTLSKESTGYYAQYYQPYYSYISEDEKKKLTDAILKDFIPGIEMKQVRVENEGKDYFGVLPFKVKATFTSDNIVEKAGTKYLFKIGDLIGRQMEMYQKEVRKLEIENDFNRNYHREMTFEIPTGYKITNLEALNMDIFSEENGERIIAFTSKYELNGIKVKVVIDEYYKKLLYPANEYENYRKVINAAADFNKVTLFLEKQ